MLYPSPEMRLSIAIEHSRSNPALLQSLEIAAVIAREIEYRFLSPSERPRSEGGVSIGLVVPMCFRTLWRTCSMVSPSSIHLSRISVGRLCREASAVISAILSRSVFWIESRVSLSASFSSLARCCAANSSAVFSHESNLLGHMGRYFGGLAAGRYS